MEKLAGRAALVTGASGGIGVHIAKRLAAEGMKVAVSGRRKDALAEVASQIAGAGATCAPLVADLADPEQLRGLPGRAEEALGPIDVLVNNAGVESVAAFSSCSERELRGMIDVNLTAPLLLAREVLPGMLERGSGHVVFISSVAGKHGPAYNAPYAAAKAGLIALTQSLRAEHAASPVGFSVVCPGFVAGDGMYARMAQDGHRSNRLIGETSTAKIADAVVRAIVEDLAEIVESGAPIRPMLALGQLSPGIAERVVSRIGATGIFRAVAESRGRA